MFGYGRGSQLILRPVRMKGFSDERMTKIGWYDIANAMTLESNKSVRY
jgi:hypothetical protein